MPLGTFGVSGVTEIHLLRGFNYQPVLANMLRFVNDAAAANEDPETLTQYNQNVRSTNALTVHFRPLGIAAAHMNHAGTVFNGFGMTLDDTTGTLHIDPAVPANRLANFIVIAEVTDAQNSNAVKSYFFRVHLHDTLTLLRLTPAELSVPRQAAGFSFTLHARFGDNVEADITHYPGLNWNISGGAQMTNERITSLTGVADGTALNVTVSMNVGASGFQAQAVAKPFTVTTEVLPMLGPGQAAAANVRNVLFLADGFTAADSDKFDSIVRNMLTDMAQSTAMFPFSLFTQRGAMNIWKCFVPSRQPGISCRAELMDRPGSPGQVLPLPALEKPAHENPGSSAQAGPWSIGRLNWVFGLATPQQSTLSDADVRTYWKSFSTVSAGDIDAITPSLLAQWKSCGKRHLLGENDTFLGTAMGTPNRFPGNASDIGNLVYFFGRRMGRIRMNGWLDQLQARDNSNTLQPLGDIWHIKENTGDTSRKDFDLICVLVNAVAGRAVNTVGGMLINISGSNPGVVVVGVTPDAATPGTFRMDDTFNVIPDYDHPVTDYLPMDKRTTFFHELAHSFTLGDEYAEGSTDPFFERFTGSPAQLNALWANLQAESELELPRAGDGVMQLEPQFIKWRWHRMEKCRELQSITRNSSTYTITFKPRRDTTNANNVFAVNDKVLLRFRHPEQTLKGDVKLSPVLKITNAIDADHVEAQVDNLNPFNPLPPNNTFDLINLEGDFGEFCLLYKPVLAPSGVRTAYYQFAELVGKNILDYMTAQHRPLTPVPCAINPDPGEPQQPILDDSVSLGGPYSRSCCSCDQRVANKSKIVGLYANGNLKHCRIFHPAGTCMMHAHQVAEFCSVCMYILAEVIAPELHPLVDVKIAEFYPV